MTFQASDAVRNAMLDASETTIGASPSLVMFQGTIPANCAAADAGTVVATLPLPPDWQAAAASGAKALLGTWQDTAADASGRARYGRIKQGATAHWQFLISDPWGTGRTFAIGDHVHNGGNVYRATSAGTSGASAPVHTAGTVSDGTVSWAFVQTGTDVTLDNATLVAGQQVNITAFNLTVGGA